MLSLKQRPKTYAVIAVLLAALIAGAFLVASLMWSPSQPRQISDSVGICVHTLSEKDAQLVKDSGAGWIRIDVSDNLSSFGASVKEAKAYNLSVLGILDSWMFNQSYVFTLDEWRGNVTYYVSQYAPYVDAWEIWNEPANPTYPLLNLNLTNAEGQQNMHTIVDFYYKMAQTAYPIIRQYDPTAKILLFGGLNLYSGGDPHLQLDENFSSQLAAKGIQEYGDAISVHAYPWGQVQPSVWQSYTASLAYYRGLFTNKSLEVWVTETGQTTEVAGKDGQANYLADALVFFRGNTTTVFWYSLMDNSHDLGSFGLIGKDTMPRPAYNEIQKAIGS